VATVQITCTAVYTLAYRGASGVELTNADGTVRRVLVADEVSSGSSITAVPLAWSPDGRLLAFGRNANGQVSVWLANLDDGSFSQLESFVPRCCEQVNVGVWSPDDRDLLLDSFFGGNTCPAGLTRYPLDPGQPPRPLYSIPGGSAPGCGGRGGLRGFTWPDWSPDGSRIVIHDKAQAQAYILTPDGTDQRVLVGGLEPDWSPDGNDIAYVAPVGGPAAVRLIHPDGTGDRPLTAPGADETDTDPAWSPDGSQVAFVRLGRGADSSVTSARAYLVGRDGTNEHQLAALPIGSFHPAWAADGVHLAYVGSTGAYVMNADGSGLHLLSTEGATALWRP
jgi:Tol biopolymer transport system component